MAEPTVRNVHQDSILSQISLGYQNAEYIGRRILPVVPVDKASDKYYVFDQAAWFRNEAGVRAPATFGPEGGYTLSTVAFQTVQQSHMTWVADEERDNADAGLDLDRQGTEFCADKVAMGHEKLAAALVFGSGNYASGHTSTLAGVTQWSDPASTPIENITETAQETIGGKIGRRGNTLVLGEQVFNKLRNHPDVMDRVKYTQTGQVSAQLLASLLEVDQLLIGRAIENTAPQGATAVYARMWGKFAALLYLPPRPGIRTLSYGYTFMWKPYNFVTERWLDSGRKATGIRTLAQYDQKVVANTAGYLFIDAVA